MRLDAIRRLGALALAAAALALAGDRVGAENPPRPWTLVYVMSYDNDLDKHAATILEQIQLGVADTPNAVSVLADLKDTRGLIRYALDAEGRKLARLPTDDITPAGVLREHLDWVAKNLPAKRYGLFFLNHGGGVDEMCQDWRRGAGHGKGWMSGREIAPVLEAFRERTGGAVELLYLQQCGRGSVENVHLFHGAAPTLMASQTRVGAPNTYYGEVLEWLDKRPKATGRQLAHAIAAADRHYFSLAVIDAAAAAELPKRLAPVIEGLDAATGLKPCYGGTKNVKETSYDLLAWLGAAGAKGPALEGFRKWFREELVLRHHVGPLPHDDKRDWCGLSIFVPEPAAVRGRQADHPFYAASGLDRLWARLYP